MDKHSIRLKSLDPKQKICLITSAFLGVKGCPDEFYLNPLLIMRGISELIVFTYPNDVARIRQIGIKNVVGIDPITLTNDKMGDWGETIQHSPTFYKNKKLLSIYLSKVYLLDYVFNNFEICNALWVDSGWLSPNHLRFGIEDKNAFILRDASDINRNIKQLMVYDILFSVYPKWTKSQHHGIPIKSLIEYSGKLDLIDRIVGAAYIFCAKNKINFLLTEYNKWFSKLLLGHCLGSEESILTIMAAKNMIKCHPRDFFDAMFFKR